MIRLLIADDETIERDALKYIIQENFAAAFEIKEAENGRKAIAITAEFQPDLILLDIKMPGLNGLQAARQIREIAPECRIVIISAYHHFNYAQDAVSLGADEYITKPASPEKIVATLTRSIASIQETRAKKHREAETVRRLEQVSRHLSEELLILIALGEIEEATIREYFNILQLDYKALLFTVISLSFPEETHTVSEIDRTIVRTQILSHLQDFLPEQDFTSLVRTMGNEIYLLLLIKKELDDYQSRIIGLELFNRLKEDLHHRYGVIMNIGIGSICRDLDCIYASFLQAKQSLHYDTTPGAITSYSDISKGLQPSYPANKERLLFDSILHGEEAHSLELLADLLNWTSENIPDLPLFRQRIYELLLVIAREIAIQTNLPEMPVDLENLRQSIFALNSVNELRSLAKNFISNEINGINAVKKSRSNALMAKVGDYLEKNYAREISLEEVAATIQISPFYLSKLFKKELGANFIDYLTGIRIRKAKEILSDPLHTVKDACYLVGYHDPNYFARVFKKSCGLTPTEYQAKYLR